MTLFFERIFILKCLVSIALLTSGAICSGKDNSCDIPRSIAYLLLGMGFGLFAGTNFSVLSIKLWLLKNENPGKKKIMCCLAFQLFCAIILIITGLVRLNKSDKYAILDGYVLIGAAVALTTNYTVSVIEALTNTRKRVDVV